MNLFKIAQENAASLEAQLNQIMDKSSPATKLCLADFQNWVLDEAGISINMKAAVLSIFMTTEKHQNIHEWAAEQAELSLRPRQEILEEKLGKYYDRRLAFDNAFEDGTRFRYGALNAGGVGLSLFGDFCMVLNRSFMESLNDAVYLPDDSLVCCFNELHQFDVEAVRRKVCPHTHRHYLVVIKHATVVQQTSREQWGRVILADGNYIEAIFTADIMPDHIAEVRVKKDKYDELFNLAFDDFGRKLDEAETAQVLHFVQILKVTRRRSISLEVLP
ncbi:MAG: hypothetical protein HQK60_07490 [Deltaproteobacteria bacterium]|nr:hypothetical protein [Deltaproteobacteria bacterium]